jgi:methanogenic corrinoid protein MtbC1
MVDVIINKLMPVYNIKAVSRLTGLLPVTLRAWERRYGMPIPRRGTQGYRLYSDYDVRTLMWLKTQIGSGLSISRSVDYLSELRSAGKDPAAQDDLPLPIVHSTSLQSLEAEFTTAMCHLDETAARDIMNRAVTMYPVERVLLDMMQPSLVHIGEAWHRGELPIASEHFASQFCVQHLHSTLHSMAAPSRSGLIVAACAPKELHQIGLLMLVTLLRLRGWDVRYLGADLNLERVEETLLPLHPDIFMISATRSETARELDCLPDILEKFSDPQPLIVLGGQAFIDVHLPESVSAIYMQGNAGETASRINELMIAIHRPVYIGNCRDEEQ